MADYKTRIGIKIAMDMLKNPNEAWLVGEHLSLMFDTGLMNDTYYVLHVIETEKAHDLLPIITQQLMTDMKVAVYDAIHGENDF
ncbi:hypothetical protein ACIFOT_07030 [Neobacillus sp. NRS-1170]|uniref:hypothetical protein n=1 Tax=Neobacillus sp. NRS-1170 TaxID=3233898 RepID=UPI003D279ECB